MSQPFGIDTLRHEDGLVYHAVILTDFDNNAVMQSI